MQVYGPTSVHASQSIAAPHMQRSSSVQSTGYSQSIQDQLELSPMASYLDSINELPEIRHDRVAQLKQQIASGAYETAERLDAALDRLLDELA